ncbi:hypothetical protein CBER1_05446 [Cercospora berteroae]|uniref:Uncharacterized protein n=1 Tax=Cercospora berteroae TaxID=357750 RepID=A0A2S6C605_9PEZI|nr:hypothetical protein CBER1_05446 [Cercospora berteroae]
MSTGKRNHLQGQTSTRKTSPNSSGIDSDDSEDDSEASDAVLTSSSGKVAYREEVTNLFEHSEHDARGDEEAEEQEEQEGQEVISLSSLDARGEGEEVTTPPALLDAHKVQIKNAPNPSSTLTPPRWMSDSRTSQMSHEYQIVFAEPRFKKLPSFNADLEVSELPPPHPLFQQEWDDCLAKVMSLWKSLDFRAEDETPTPTCYAALVREPDFVFTCTLRAWESSWMIGYRGPCVVEDMIRFWETIDDHVALSPGVPVEVGSNKIIYLRHILPPTILCRACNKSHMAFRAEYVMQIGLHRLTVDKIDALARN